MIALKVSACLLSGSQLLVAGERCSDGLCSCVLAVGGRAEHSALLLQTVTAHAQACTGKRSNVICSQTHPLAFHQCFGFNTCVLFRVLPSRPV